MLAANIGAFFIDVYLFFVVVFSKNKSIMAVIMTLSNKLVYEFIPVNPSRKKRIYESEYDEKNGCYSNSLSDSIICKFVVIYFQIYERLANGIKVQEG